MLKTQTLRTFSLGFDFSLGLIPSFRAQSRYLSSTTANQSTISAVIQHDHRELEAYYKEILRSTDEDSTTRWQNQFVWELARHSIGEELVVYPAFEKYLPDGKSMAAKDRAHHGELKTQLKHFQNLSPDSASFRPTISALMETLSAHIQEEEHTDLPALENELRLRGSEKTSEKLARSFERTKMFVPTRSHPMAPDKPPFETVVGLMAAPVDKLMDVFRRFPQTAAEGLEGNDK